jgi:sodium/bile acid cotransporter 7
MRPWIGAWVGRQKRLLTIIDRSSILLVVYSAFSAAVVEGIWRRVSAEDMLTMGVASIAMLSFLLMLTRVIAARLHFDREIR